MLAQTPPMGWNTWNTFGHDINEEVVLTSADAMVELGYRDAGYEYIVIDDCWMLRERDENGNLVPDPERFPHGMKYVADYIHAKGLKFGIYSCAGVRTCAAYPASYGHEYADARLFASWGVDFLKYDFCNFPSSGNGKNAYLTMSMALKASGRDILFSACNWGVEDPWNWMRSIGAHMYRSTGDIQDNFVSTTDIIKKQMDNYNANAAGCFNDTDMLTVGMFGRGLVANAENVQTYTEYETQFAYWCMSGAPLMMGGDIRHMDEQCRALMQNKELIRLNQDKECRPLYRIREQCGVFYMFFRHLENNEFAAMMLNLADKKRDLAFMLTDAGIPTNAGMAVEVTDILTGETFVRRDDIFATVEAHSCKLYRCRFVNG